MKKLYCVICGKYGKFEKPKKSCTFKKTLVYSVVCSKCKNEDQKIFKEEESIEILKILVLIEANGPSINDVPQTSADFNHPTHPFSRNVLNMTPSPIGHHKYPLPHDGNDFLLLKAKFVRKYT